MLPHTLPHLGKTSRNCQRFAPKTSHVLEKKLQRFWKNLPRFSRNVGRFLLSLEEMKTKLRCLSFTPRKQESKVVNQQILKWCSHARTPTRITAIFVFLLSQPSQKSLQLSIFQFIARTFRTYFNTFWKTLRFFLLISSQWRIAKLLIFSSKMRPKLPLVWRLWKQKVQNPRDARAYMRPREATATGLRLNQAFVPSHS